MTELNPPLRHDASAAPVPYANADKDAGPGRPPSVVILSVAALVLGALGVLGCGLHQLLEGYKTAMAGGYPLPGGAVIPSSAALQAFNVSAAVADLLTSAALFVTAYLGLRLSPGGRRWAVRTAAAIVVLAAVKLVGSAVVFRQELIDQKLAGIASLPAEQLAKVPADFPSTIRTMSVWGPVTGFVIQALVPALILTFWTRAGVRAAFDRPAGR